jgi:hypothetical protein
VRHQNPPVPFSLRGIVQAGRLLDTSEYRVKVENWCGNGGATQRMSQAASVMAGCKLCLDALEDEAERRQAREYIRTLGGQVHLHAECPRGLDKGRCFCTIG